MASDIKDNAQVSSSLIQNEKSGHKAALTSSDLHQKAICKTAEGTSDSSKVLANPVSKELNPTELINKVSEQVQKLQEVMDMNNWSVNFSVDEESGNTVIKVKDGETQDIMRQVPTHEWLSMAQRIQESLDSSDNKAIAGLLLDNKI